MHQSLCVKSGIGESAYARLRAGAGLHGARIVHTEDLDEILAIAREIGPQGQVIGLEEPDATLEHGVPGGVAEFAARVGLHGPDAEPLAPGGPALRIGETAGER